MVYESLIAIVESHLEKLTETWIQEVNGSQYLETYKKLSEVELHARGNLLFTNLLEWLLKGASNDDAAVYFTEVGSSRMREGFPLTEIYLALHLEKKVLWSFVAWKDEVTGILKPKDAIEFMTVINNYFDLGNLYIIKGFHTELYKNLANNIVDGSNKLEKNIAYTVLSHENVKVIKEKIFNEGLTISIVR